MTNDPQHTGRAGIYFKLVLTTFFWGGTFVAARFAVHEAPPFFAASCRFAIAAVVLMALVARQAQRRGETVPVPHSLREVLALSSLGLTGIFCYNAFFFSGLKLTGAANGSLIVAINPLLTAVLSAWWLRERIRPLQGVGLAVSLAGVGVIVTRGDLGVLRTLTFNHGDLLLLGAPLSWAAYSILGKRAMGTFSPLVATAYAALSGTLLLIPAAVLEALGGAGPHRFSILGWVAILQLALLGTVAGFVWWYEGVQALGASRAALFVNLVPVFGTLLAALLLGERLGWPQLWGGMLVIAGVCGGTVRLKAG
ncbi:EamA family transporter [Oryzomonas japonica]|uniref:EamA family transporter n=1 Tax=Oryzomonas japonica TaxID=2603858 RepID=A0A7J4ZRR2_9BACT|nr:EamA family transporter [Oryzomonas japonica]KAB0666006.1 EamA family transporter [Oryzomonas japonica]